jgi:hypothetical protein
MSRMPDASCCPRNARTCEAPGKVAHHQTTLDPLALAGWQTAHSLVTQSQSQSQSSPLALTAPLPSQGIAMQATLLRQNTTGARTHT